jgi:hypothetical protein
MLASAATELAASSSGLMQADDDIPGHAGGRNESVPRTEPGLRPSLRRLILKPRKIVVKGAPSARRSAQTLDHGSWRGFTGAYRKDGWVRVPLPSTGGHRGSRRSYAFFKVLLKSLRYLRVKSGILFPRKSVKLRPNAAAISVSRT